MEQRVATARGGSAQRIRRMNAQLVLGHMWCSEPMTASALIEATGLTRATVLALCRELTEHGWLKVLQNAREAGAYARGRPALRYAFREDACLVIGVDAGQHRVSASVCDLRGTEIGQAERVLDPRLCDPVRHSGRERRTEILAVIEAALEDAEAEASAVGAMVIGVPAPTDAQGQSPLGVNAFWDSMNPELASLGEHWGVPCIVENDANLAAVGELDVDPQGHDSAFAALLSGERMGAGIMVEGVLMRQPRGGAGELGMLTMVAGVESDAGLGRWAADAARQALAAAGHERWRAPSLRAEDSSLAGIGVDAVRAEHVFVAAAQGDGLAREIEDLLADRLARICAVLAGLLDLDRVIVSGAVAPALRGAAEAARQKLGDYIHAPWLEISVSELGEKAVRRGAVSCAVEQVRQRALGGEASVRRPSSPHPEPDPD